MKKSKLRLLGSLAALLALALAVSCTGFFQNPTLTTITIDPPTPSINLGATQQLTATGTFQDNSTQPLTGGTSCSGNTVCWSSSDTTIATISVGGLLTGVGQGTATITAASGAITGTATATVDLANVTNYEVCEGTFGSATPCSSGSTALTWNAQSGETEQFIAQGSSNGTTVDLTASSTWTMTSAAPTNGSIECTIDVVSPEECTVASGTSTGTYTFSVTYGSTTVLTATLNINVQ